MDEEFPSTIRADRGWLWPVAGKSLRLPLIYAALLLAAQAGTLKFEPGSAFTRTKLPVPTQGKTGFEKLDNTQLGILFTNRLSETRAIMNRNLLNGSGVAIGDVDGDGRPDIYFCGLDSDNVLYRNLGNWKFEDITRLAGVACPNQDSTGAVFADVNGDGSLDLLVSSLGHGVRLFLNDGKGHFREATDQAGLRSNAASMTMALADIDGDGDLDLFVANYRVDTIADMPTTTFRVQNVGGKPTVVQVNGQPATLPQWTNRFTTSPAGNVVELGEPPMLYLNDGKGKFSPVSFTDGAFLDEDGQRLTEPPRDWGLAVQFHDLNGDGAPDIYVCNDFFTPDRIWMNNGKGHFRAIARTAIRSTSAFSMGVDAADIDRDGNVDLFVVDMLSPDHRKRHVQLGGRSSFTRSFGRLDNRPQVSRNTLQLNRGDGTFAEIGFYAGVEASDWSWCPLFLDVDLDGYEDLLVSNGVLRDFQNMDMANRFEAATAGKKLSQKDVTQFMRNFPTLATPHVLFRNKGDRTFEEVGAAWGFATPAVSQGMALGDLDNDGDLDVVVNNMGGPPGIYRNVGIAPRLAIRLKGDERNIQGIGGKITVRGGPVEQTAEMICGGHYLSGSEAMRVFAAGTATNLEVQVDWRDGRQSVVHAEPNFLYEIDQQSARPTEPAKSTQPASWFESVPGLEAAVHIDQPYDDLARQPLLLKFLSQLGPGVSWHDLNGDGWEDLIVGSGRGGSILVLENDGQGHFSRQTNAPAQRTVARDETTVLGMGPVLVAGSSNYEDGSTNGGLLRVYDFQRKTSGETLLGHASGCGPLALTDVNGQGGLFLFIGGRVVPGRYPEAADSFLYRLEGGRPILVQRFEKLGLVSGAVFSDLDQDGFPELILATEWGPVRVFKLIEGKYQERTHELGLDAYTGWWNGVATGDFYGDGRIEIVASNWGLNSAYRASPEHPRKLYYGDFDGNGTIDLVEARFDPAMGKEVPERTFNVMLMGLPSLQTRIPSYDAYAHMGVQEIYGESLTRAAVLEVNTFQSMVFTLDGGKFQGHPLPAEAQFAPAFGVCVGDLDGDGAEDIFLSQNFFALAPTEPRIDAGRGLWLKGDGHGHFRAVPGQESGIEIYGEQRGCALADYDGDGRVDLAVAQNSNALKLLHNVRARPALRVRLKGAPGNPTGLGASMRLESDGIKSALREVQAGGGYWSQNSPVQVLAVPGGQQASAIRVQWPGGKAVTSAIPNGAKEIEVSLEGVVKVLH